VFPPPLLVDYVRVYKRRERRLSVKDKAGSQN
jgi:hypothetical protein